MLYLPGQEDSVSDCCIDLCAYLHPVSLLVAGPVSVRDRNVSHCAGVAVSACDGNVSALPVLPDASAEQSV